MRTLSVVKSTFLVSSLLASALIHADNSNFNASRTFEFDPDKLGCAVAGWKNGIGLPDSTGKTSFGMHLEKNCATTEFVAAGAVLNGVKGTVITTGSVIGFDIKDGSLCTGGSPRFNVQASDGFHFLGGCGNATMVSLGNGWTRITIDPLNPAQAFPPIASGSTVGSIVLIVDEEGMYDLDNIQLNGAFAEKPGAAR